jgi:hypothetical protein
MHGELPSRNKKGRRQMLQQISETFLEECCHLGCHAIWLVRTGVSEDFSASVIRVK